MKTDYYSIGIDPSLTSTGWAILDHAGAIVRCGVSTGSLAPTGSALDDELARIVEIVDDVEMWVRRYALNAAKACRHHPTQAVLVCNIEAASFNSVGGKSDERGGLRWMLLNSINELTGGSAWLMATPPATMKKYTTGSGVATKEAIQAQVNDRWNLGLPIRKSGSSTDIADAVALASMAHHIRTGIDLMGGTDGSNDAIIDRLRTAHDIPEVDSTLW